MKFFCECGQKLSASEMDVGRKCRCTRCKKSFVVPSPEELEARAEAKGRGKAERSDAREAKPPPPPPAKALKFHCECGQKLGVPREAVGQKGRCPSCHAPFRVPAPEAVTAEAQEATQTEIEQAVAEAPEPRVPEPVPQEADEPSTEAPKSAVLRRGPVRLPPPPATGAAVPVGLTAPAPQPEATEEGAPAGKVIAEGWFIEALDIAPRKLTELFYKLSGDCAPVRLIDAGGTLTFSCRPLRGTERIRVLGSMLFWLAYLAFGLAVAPLCAMLWGPACLVGFDLVGFFSWPFVVLRTVVDMYHGVRAGFYLLGKIIELVFAMLFGAEYYYVPRRYADVLPTLATAPRGSVSQLHVVDAKQARKATGWIKRLLSAKGILALAVLFSALSGVGLIGMTVEEMGNGFKAAHIFQIVFGGVMLAVSAVGGMKIAAMAHRASWVLALVVGAALPSGPESDGRSGGLRGLFGKAKQGGEEKAARTVLLFLPDKAYAQEIEALERQVSAVCAPEQRIVSQ